LNSDSIDLAEAAEPQAGAHQPAGSVAKPPVIYAWMKKVHVNSKSNIFFLTYAQLPHSKETQIIFNSKISNSSFQRIIFYWKTSKFTTGINNILNYFLMTQILKEYSNCKSWKLNCDNENFTRKQQF
ncbi:hypothetical protein BpHYR1_045711, partial [Brachionus plicatilis]